MYRWYCGINQRKTLATSTSISTHWTSTTEISPLVLHHSPGVFLILPNAFISICFGIATHRRSTTTGRWNPIAGYSTKSVKNATSPARRKNQDCANLWNVYEPPVVHFQPKNVFCLEIYDEACKYTQKYHTSIASW